MTTFATITSFMSTYLMPTPKTNLRKNRRTELILSQYYPFYLKLTDRDKNIFLDRLEEVFAQLTFRFEDEHDYDNFKYQLLVAAEICHYVISQKKAFFKLLPFEVDVLSSKDEHVLGAEVFKSRTVIHWEKFIEELKNGEETGLIRIMLDQLLNNKIHLVDKTLKDAFLNIKMNNGERRSLFNIYDVVDKNTFYKACFRSYFLFPQEMRNIHPKIFRQVDYVLFNNN